MRAETGVVAAGHPLTAQAGAQALREGGNAVDAARRGDADLVRDRAAADRARRRRLHARRRRGDRAVAARLLRAAPTRRGDGSEAELDGDRCFLRRRRAGIPRRSRLLRRLWRPRGRLRGDRSAGARCRSSSSPRQPHGSRARVCALNAGQAYVAEILAELLTSTPECAALWAPAGRVLREGETLRQPRARRRARAPRARRRGALLPRRYRRRGLRLAERARRLAHAARTSPAIEAIAREPVTVRLPRPRDPHQPAALRRRHAARLRARAARPRRPRRPRSRASWPRWSPHSPSARPSSSKGSTSEGFLERFLGSRLGSTTHISVIDADGLACSTTCTNGEGSGVVVPGTGMHLNNVMGEEDLNPLGFHLHPAGRRMPSMMAPSVVMRDGEVELVLGSAGSNRIRSALLQTIVAVVDHGCRRQRGCGCAARALRGRRRLRRARASSSTCSTPSCTSFASARATCSSAACRPRCAVTASLSGAGDPRRGGVAVSAVSTLHVAVRFLLLVGLARLRLWRGQSRGSLHPHAHRPRAAARSSRCWSTKKVACAVTAVMTLKLSDPQLVQARALQEDLHDHASKHLTLAPRRGSVYSYSLRDDRRHVRFSDNSARPATRAARPAAVRPAGRPAGLPLQ